MVTKLSYLSQAIYADTITAKLINTTCGFLSVKFNDYG